MEARRLHRSHEARMMTRWLARGALVAALLACFVLGQGESAAPAQTKVAPKLPADHAALMAKGLDLFKKHVKPLLVENCVRCHGGRATLAAALGPTDRGRPLKG